MRYNVNKKMKKRKEEKDSLKMDKEWSILFMCILWSLLDATWRERVVIFVSFGCYSKPGLVSAILLLYYDKRHRDCIIFWLY